MRHLLLSIVFCGFYYTGFCYSAEQSDHKTAKPMHVVFFAPEPNGVEFWDLMVGVMQATVTDLPIKLELERFKVTEYPFNNIIARLEQVAQSDNPPDYIISPLYLGIEDKWLEIIEKNGINFLSINRYIPKSLFQRLGKPREKYLHWLGHIAPNDIHVGEMLAHYLFKTAKSRFKKSKKLRLLAIAAQQNNQVSELRRQGLMLAINRHTQLELVELVYSDWLSKSAELEANKLLEKHKNISIFWNVSISTAMGTIQASKQQSSGLGKTMFVGGIDWTLQAIQAVKSGDLEVSFGGHFLDGSKALILLYDHFHGADFIDKTGPVIETKLRAMNKQNVLFFEEKLSNPQWQKLNFKKFSLFENKSASRYNFDTEYFFKF